MDNILFVGGICGSEVLGMYDLSSESPTWVSLEIPEKIKRYNKRIDDLLIDGDRLIAVDNMVFPKWILLYDISIPDSPQLISYPKLKPHGPNEHISMGSLGGNWLALLSSSVGMRGAFNYISLLKKRELVESLVLSSRQPSIITKHSKKEQLDYIQWGKICFIDDTLLISAFKNGVGVLNIKEDPSKENLSYCFPEFIPGDSVINIIPVPSEKEVIVISTDSEETFFTIASKNNFL